MAILYYPYTLSTTTDSTLHYMDSLQSTFQRPEIGYTNKNYKQPGFYKELTLEIEDWLKGVID